MTSTSSTAGPPEAPDSSERELGTNAGSQRRRIALAVLVLLSVVMLLPESPVVPVLGASSRDWNRNSFWYQPWGRSGVHKGIDIFAPRGRAIAAPTYGVVVFRGDIAMGGKVLVLLGPKLRLHYFAHLDSAQVRPGVFVRTGRPIATVGDSGNARGKPPHLHYAVVTLVPYVWLADGDRQGWKKTRLEE